MSRFVHYKWLEIHLPAFIDAVGVRGGWDAHPGLISAHGDKFYTYKDEWAAAGLHFAHGCAIGLLSYCHPFSTECRETPAGWVDVARWVLDNKGRFLALLPTVDEDDPRYLWGTGGTR